MHTDTLFIYIYIYTHLYSIRCICIEGICIMCLPLPGGRCFRARGPERLESCVGDFVQYCETLCTLCVLFCCKALLDMADHVTSVETLSCFVDSSGKRVTPNLPTNTVDFGGCDSSIILIYRGGILMSIGDFPESLSQATLVGIMLVGRLGVLCWRPAPAELGRGSGKVSRHRVGTDVGRFCLLATPEISIEILEES